MDARLFIDKRMGLRGDMLNMNMANRLYHDAKGNVVFANLSGISLENEDDLETFREPFEAFLADLGQKVNLISNHDGMSIAPRLAGKWADLLSRLESDYYLTACRYSTSPFLRQKLGQDLKNRAIAPHIFETQKEAAAYLASTGSA
jgi:propionate CoA-transferase